MPGGAPDLKVRVGLLFDEKSLAGIERSMRGAGQRLSRIGTDLSLSLSLPLAAFGATAIKAAGDMESLTLALKSQLGTADAAAKELEKLTEAAKNPGLGVEQAVRGSIRLQGVGLAADEARQILIQMGNAIASTGGTATELDAVTRQFSQMISKGRVLQEDVSILSENMPGLAGLMQKAFGTQSVEAIRAMGVSGKDFVLRITEMAKELPRVEGGIKNGIGNAIDSLKQSAAKVGLAINEAFDVTGTIEAVSGALLGLAQAFSSLDPTMKTVILSIGGMLIAIGPLLKAKGALMLAVSQLTPLWGPFAGALSTVTKAFLGLNVAVKSFLIIGLAAAILAIADSWGWFNQEATVAQKAQSSINKVMGDAEASISGEKAAIGKLISVLNDETSSREAKKKALNDLKAISPEYFGQLRIENGLVVGLAAAYEGYIQNILLAAKAKKAEARLIEIDQQKTEQLKLQAQEQERLNKLQAEAQVRRGGFGAKDSFDAGGGTSAAGAAAAAITASKKVTEQLAIEEAELTKISKQYFETSAQAAASGKTRQVSAKDAAAALKEENKAATTLKEVLSDIFNATEAAKLLGDNQDIAKLEALRKGVERLLDAGFKPASAEVQNLKAQLDALTAKPHDVLIDIIQKPDAAFKGVGGISGQSAPSPALPTLKPVSIPSPDLTEAKALADAWRDVYIGAAQEVAGAVLGIFSEMNARKSEEEIASVTAQYEKQIAAAEGNAELQGQLQAELASRIESIRQQTARKQKRLAIAEAVMNTAVAVTKALTSAPPPFNIPAAIAAGIAGAAQIATIAAQPLARGTGDFGGGTALVGERGPELLTLPRHTQVSSNPRTNQILNGMGDGGTVVGGTVRFDGRDMYLMIEKQDQIAKRTRGYGLNG